MTDINNGLVFLRSTYTGNRSTTDRGEDQKASPEDPTTSGSAGPEQSREPLGGG